MDLGSSRSSGRTRFPAPYRPAGSRSRTAPRSDSGLDASRGRAAEPRGSRTPTDASRDAGRRSIDAYRGATTRSALPRGADRAGTSSRGSGGLSAPARGTGSGTLGGRSGQPASGGKIRRGEDVRYGHGPVRRLKEPRGTSSARSGGISGAQGPGKTPRGTDTSVRSAGKRVQRNLDGARKLDDSRPGAADGIAGAGHAIDRVNRAALRASVGSVGGLYRSPYRGGSYGGYQGKGYSGGYYGGWGWGVGFGYSNCGWSWGWGYGYGWGYSSWWGPCNAYWWPWYVGCYYPLWYSYYRPAYYASAYPAYWSSEVYRTVYVQEVPLEEEVVEEPVRTPVPNSLSIAADRYLTLGDRAFREGRYTDAVQFYAKAVEYAPGEGAMYLVLADALFAAGDYHYAAYAVRRALELDGTLVEAPVDKHAFYPVPEEFDRQLAVLETYVVEHPSDRDARLVLALNYLFGARPAAAVDLLNSSASEALEGDPAANKILLAARTAQFGAPAAEAPVIEAPVESVDD